MDPGGGGRARAAGRDRDTWPALWRDGHVQHLGRHLLRHTDAHRRTAAPRALGHPEAAAIAAAGRRRSSDPVAEWRRRVALPARLQAHRVIPDVDGHANAAVAAGGPLRTPHRPVRPAPPRYAVLAPPR